MSRLRGSPQKIVRCPCSRHYRQFYQQFIEMQIEILTVLNDKTHVKLNNHKATSNSYVY